MMAQSKEKCETIITDPPPKLSEKETAGLQYVGGYVLHKLYNKHKIRSHERVSKQLPYLRLGKWKTTMTWKTRNLLPL